MPSRRTLVVRDILNGVLDAYGEELDDDVAYMIEQSIDAGAATLPGALDDLMLLELILQAADDTVLRALGSRSKTLLREVTAERARVEGQPRAMPAAEDVVRFAATEAWELGGYRSAIEPVHVLLALFAFRGAASEDVLQRAGIDWRPLRSIVRRQGWGRM
jgi:hypothetical protein